MRIGVYAGSFNPVHIGHKYVMDYLLDNNYLDKIIVIPTGNYWDKTDLIKLEHRVNMLKFYESDKIIVNSKLSNKEYTYEILNELNKEYDDLYLIIGADNIIKFHLWKNIDEILKNKVIVLNRDGINIKKYICKYEKKNNFVLTDNFKEIDISSTNIRNNIYKYKDYLDKNIFEYIINNNLYN